MGVYRPTRCVVCRHLLWDRTVKTPEGSMCLAHYDKYRHLFRTPYRPISNSAATPSLSKMSDGAMKPLSE